MRATLRQNVRLAVVVAICVACAAGCVVKKSVESTTGTASAGGGSASGGASSTAPGHLLQIHDPRQVTGIAPTSCHTLPGPRPDPVCTPGAIDPTVTQADIQSTICRSGYTETVRPPSSQTDKLKRAMYTAYGIPSGTSSELDHLVSLELGGSNDAANLWPEVGSQPNPKDAVENDLHKAVCSGKVTLAAAQQAIATNWQTAETVLGLSH
jgi:hypothetical protein